MNKRIFAACPDTPNFVSSMEIGTSRYVEPLRYQGLIEEAKKRLLEVINSFGRTRVLENTDTYVKAAFTSFLFRFTDDVEFHIDDEKKLIQLKSASRVGYSYLGADRRRCEAIRKRFNR